MEITFARRQHGDTHWIEMEYTVGSEPTALLAGLAYYGWKPDGMGLPPMEKITWDANNVMIRHGIQVQELLLTGPKGSALFGGWTPEEKRQHMADARKVLRFHGFTRVPVWTKTLQDML